MAETEWTKPPSMGPPDVEVMFALTGRSPVYSGYRGQYLIKPDYRTSTVHNFLDAKVVSIGDKARAEVWLITPEVYPHTLWEGRTIDVTEGAKVVGTVTVLKVHNPLLLGSAQDWPTADRVQPERGIVAWLCGWLRSK